MTLSLQRNRRRAVCCGLFLLPVAFIALLGSTPTRADQQRQRVELQVIATPKVGPLAPQEWLAVLQQLPLDNIRIHTGTGREKPSLQRKRGMIRITGVLSGQNTLLLPGKRFSLRDRTGLATWLDELVSDRAKAVERFAFGLTAQQLVAVHDALKPRVSFSTDNASTAGRKTEEVVDDLAQLIELPITISPAARAGLSGDFPVTDELKGLASGTALAAVLRPVGLVFYPHQAGKSLVIATVDEYQQAWPIGWPTEKNPQDIAPVFFRKLEIEIDDTPLTDVVASLQQRMQMPIIFDQNGMARQRIKPHDIHVSLPKRRTFYKRALDLTLRQAKLRAELRVDENERPFIWVVPQRAGGAAE